MCVYKMRIEFCSHPMLALAFRVCSAHDAVSICPDLLKSSVAHSRLALLPISHYPKLQILTAAAGRCDDRQCKLFHFTPRCCWIDSSLSLDNSFSFSHKNRKLKIFLLRLVLISLVDACIDCEFCILYVWLVLDALSRWCCCKFRLLCKSQ
jgi:hypothetical protein